ncbi:hypothetical protein WN48_00814 [Eufriesea mexicana]|uniref:uncharacterized protein LOC108547721 n=1 Tax=Eufriesea mexicana TaxID=516756 RepID=UPI00083C903F|nr:PREDICTED: uncharacterized protein LOC108547721 [Eufriesea mexicana]OAD58022.1 hypothetical protein WN48_00814 [Eufriesea mexicana]
MVPCAQGRVVVETARPALPYFATCTRYRRQVTITSMPNEIAASVSGTSSSTTQTDQLTGYSSNRGAISKNMFPAQSTAARPEDLGVTPWYLEDYPTIDSSPMGDRGSYPSYSHMDTEMKPEATSTRNSSIDSELPRPAPVSAAPRKAYMDLRDAIALLDETCPNQEPSPSLTPRTPRTPLTPHPRNKRARSKSSDNSSSYSNERLNDRSFEKESKEKKRPFLKKIGISKTEDKPFLAKLAPKIIGKPYLEKIGPSKAVEKPFLDKIGSSKTLDKFIFDTPRYEKKSAKTETYKEEMIKKSVDKEMVKKSEERRIQKSIRMEQSFDVQRRKSGKGPLLKMYSFETEDLESTVQVKEHRDPLRGASLDDVLDSGPSSLPLETTTTDESPRPESKERATNGAELLKCRVTTSEEIIFTNTSFGSDKEPNSWGNSPKKKWLLKRDTSMPRTPTHRKVIQSSQNVEQAQDSVPNSPMKRPISSVLPSQDDSQADSSEKNVYSPMKTRRQTYEDLLDRNDKNHDEKPSKQAQFERRGISSDNLLSKDRSIASIRYQGRDQVEKTREATSEDSLAHKTSHEYTRETFKQLQDKFRYHEIPTETYADFKRRTRGNVQSIIGRQQDKLKANNIIPDTCDESSKDSKSQTEETPTSVSSTPAKMETDSSSDGKNEVVRIQGGTVRSVLKKQQGIDHASDQELDTNSSIRRPKRRIFHEPSQETMDLLTELRKVKSLLKTPSWEKDLELDKKPVRQPKRILLTDKEFCLSVERENSIRRPSKVINSLEKTEEGQSDGVQDEDKEEEKKETEIEESNGKIPGPALFEKKCLSLDYADDEKPQKPEARAISLASTRNLPSEAEETIDYSDLALICDSKSYSSDVFNTPSDETNQRERGIDLEKNDPKGMSQNHCAEVDIAIPIDQKASSPKGRVQIQGRTSDLYEIISPRSTPFRVKKRLGKISVEETVKPESFTLGSKVDCRSTVAQKRTKCFPL